LPDSATITLKAHNKIGEGITCNILTGSLLKEASLHPVPAGFKSIRLSFNVDCEAKDEQIQTLVKLTEKYCIVYQTLVKGIPIETTFHKQWKIYIINGIKRINLNY